MGNLPSPTQATQVAVADAAELRAFVDPVCSVHQKIQGLASIGLGTGKRGAIFRKGI